MAKDKARFISLVWIFRLVRSLLAITLAFVLMISFANSYAQSPQNNMAINVQIKVENSDGALIAYLETDKVRITNYADLNTLLDSNSPVLHKKIITIGDQKYDLIKATAVLVHPYDTIVSENLISAENGNSQELLALAYHDGYPVVKGDKVTTYWTILRPVS